MRGVTAASLLAAWGILGGAGAAQAECFGDCYGKAITQLAFLALYALLGLAVLVMLLRRKWRRAGLWTLGLSLAIGAGVPILSQGWLAWKLAAMERREVAGTPPALRDRVPLMIATDTDTCYLFSCDLILDRAGEAGMLVLRRDALAALDPAQPIDLASLPLERWQRPLQQAGEIRARALGPDEARVAAATIDYLVVTNHLFVRQSGPVEAALLQHPDLAGMRKGEVAILAMAPLPPGGPLSFATLDFDLLDLSLADTALGLPLAPNFKELAPTEVAGLDAAIAAICPDADEWGIPECREAIAGPDY